MASPTPRPNALNPEPQELSEGSIPTEPCENFGNANKPPKLSIPLLLFNDADTLLYIDSAPENRPRTIALPPTIPHRVHSEKLLATGSAYFARLFKPRYQARIRKQRGYADQLPDGIKYLVDLTPAILEEDAVITLTEVSCPMAIRTWASYQHVWTLPASCVGGEDEREFSEIREPVNLSEPYIVRDNGNQSDEYDQETDNGSECPPDTEPRRRFRAGLPVEYSTARHREGIEHVLHVLEGLNISLDTPCKLWTFFAIAKLYDVATLPSISGYIVSWFYENHNTRFIALHPEIAYRVACGIRSTTLCRDAFVGLVNDEALLYLIRSALLEPTKQWKPSFLNSRMKDVLDDTEVQRIEYASKTFADDIIKHFIHLAGEEMAWLAEIPEFTKITRHATDYPEDREAIHVLVTSLKDTIRNAIYRLLSNVEDPVRFCDAVPSEQPKPYYRAFLQRDMLVRIMGVKFWSALATSNVYLSYESPLEPLSSTEHETIADVGYGLLAFQGQENASIRGVPREILDSQIQDFNELVGRRAKQAQISMERAAQSKAAEEEKRQKLVINLRREVQLDDESPFFPMDTTLPDRSANQANSPFLCPPVQNPSKNSIFPKDTPHTDASNEVQPSAPEYLLAPEGLLASEYLLAFDFRVFIASAMAYISSYSRPLIYTWEQLPFHKNATDLLTCLTDHQWQYLPLWAGGNDDETGGVFADHEIPTVDTGGFSAPGPAVHTGSIASTDDSFSEINPSDSQSTVQRASHHATYSHTSEIMSMYSSEEVQFPKEMNLSTKQAFEPTLAGDDLNVSSAKSDCADDFDVQSTGASTVVMGSPNLSGFSDDDVDMTTSDDDFELM